MCYANSTSSTSCHSAVHHDHLIIAGGNTSTDVNILDTFNNKWKTAQPLPSTASYRGVIAKDTMYLVGWDNQAVLQAHVPALISGAKSGVWGTVTNAPYYWSSPVTIGNTFLTVGGTDKSLGGNIANSIQLYNPNTSQWTRVGDLPEPMYNPCCIIQSSELYVLGFTSIGTISQSGHVHAAKLTVLH